MNNLGNLLSKSIDKEAIIFDRSYSYKELNSISSKFSYGLYQAGVSKGDKVAIIDENSVMFICAYIGILKLGAVAVLINPNLPKEIHDYILQDSLPKVILNKNNYKNFLQDGLVNVADVDLQDPAFILYTSGSTSKPKGVIVTHNHFWTIKQKAENKSLPSIRMLVAAPCYHMNGLSNLEVALAGGATVILMKKFDSKKVLNLISRYKINYISSVPTMISLLLQDLQDHDVSSIKFISMASAPVSQHLYEKIKMKLPGVKISIAYGSTEAGPGLFGKHPTKPTPNMSVGYPVTGIEYRIIDGILQIKSPSMMLKYSNRDANLTPDGFLITNDLFKVDKDGFYYFVGRADDMFVCSGNNVYPSYIEETIEEYSKIKDVAVIGIENEVQGMIPVAFVTVNEPFNKLDLFKFLESKLPKYLIPKNIWVINNMPLTSLHKFDKDKLKDQARENINHGKF